MKRRSWPIRNQLLVNGLSYDQFADYASANAGIQDQWLRLQPDKEFPAQPFEQLATVLRNMGLEEEAVKVMIAKNERHGQYTKRFRDWFWYNALGKAIGYGYRPWNALGISVVIIVIGTFVFWLGFGNKILTPTDEKAYEAYKIGRPLESYPRFHPFFYSLETFVPLVKLGIDEHWAPNANLGDEVSFVTRMFLNRLLFGRRASTDPGDRHFRWKVGGLLRCYLWVHILLGWVLTTLWVGGLTGPLKT